MTKFTALALRPIVYVLDIGIALTGAQTFKEAHTASKTYLKIILNRYRDGYDNEEGTGIACDKMPGHGR